MYIQYFTLSISQIICESKVIIHLEWKIQYSQVEVFNVSSSDEIDQDELKTGSNIVIYGYYENKTSYESTAQNAGSLGKG